MKDFVVGQQDGHDHFLATFGKFGLVAGQHSADGLADVATRAASENQLYVETAFNLGKNIGDLAASTWTGTLTANDLQALYDGVVDSGQFAAALAKDVDVVTQARAQYRTALGCSAASPPAACDVGVRFVAQVSRTGSVDQIFGQLLGAFEMAAATPDLVAVELTAPEDDTTSLKNYSLHMQMLDFLHQKYTVTGASPLHVTLQAGELTASHVPAQYLPAALKAHIHDAVYVGHAERIAHGVDILGEDNANALLTEMSNRGVLVEACLSSNAQLLEITGAAHPLAAYIDAHVPVALATDFQGISRSSLAGEYFLAATDQHLSYRQLKRMARDSLEHAFLPGDSLWSSLANLTPVAACSPTQAMGIGDAASATCQLFLDDSARARAQWELERRFRAFESQQ
jgi:adenosine deaminase